MNYYELLEIEPDADVETIKRAIAQASVRWSKRIPMAISLEKRREAEDILQAIAKARETLLVAESRAEYDHSQLPGANRGLPSEPSVAGPVPPAAPMPKPHRMPQKRTPVQAPPKIEPRRSGSFATLFLGIAIGGLCFGLFAHEQRVSSEHPSPARVAELTPRPDENSPAPIPAVQAVATSSVPTEAETSEHTAEPPAEPTDEPTAPLPSPSEDLPTTPPSLLPSKKPSAGKGMEKHVTVLPAGHGKATPALVAATKGDRQPHVRVVTTKGTFEVELYPKIAPKTVRQFLQLVESGFYDQTTFHRVIPGFVAQGGDPLSKTSPPGDASIGTGGSGLNVPDEFSPQMKHETGSLALAHSGLPNSGSSQFYICYRPLPMLDGKYCVFGRVTKGMDVIEQLNLTERDGVRAEGIEPDKMLNLKPF